MAQHLKVLAALEENPSLVPNTFGGWGLQPTVTPAPRDQMPFSGLCRYQHICGTQKYTHKHIKS